MAIDSLPRSLDVVVNVSKPQTEATVDLSTAVFCTTEGNLDFDNSRIRFYSTSAAVAEDFGASSESYKAAQAWFSQTPHAKTFAVGRIFTESQAAFLQCGVIGTVNLATWQAITDGAFKITIGATTATVSGIDFSGITALSGIASTIQTELRAASEAADFASATVTLDDNNRLRITSGTTGDASIIGYLETPASGTDISGAEYMNGAIIPNSEIQSAYVVDGYTYEGIEDELTRIKTAGIASGKFVYGFALEKSFRDTNDAFLAAEWAEAQDAAILGLTTNSPAAYDASSNTDLGAKVFENGFHRVFVTYHDNPYYYPEVSILAYALSVDYNAQDSTITTKFKQLPGIPTVTITETELSVLEAKRINTYTLIGESSRTFREGVEGNPAWFIDDLINLDNFKEDLQVAVYNVFLRNKKVPYTAAGVSLIYGAIDSVCAKYVYNGTLAPRALTEAEIAEQNVTEEPAYSINITPIGQMSASDRAKRIGPPARIILNLAGAIHSIVLNVEAYN